MNLSKVYHDKGNRLEKYKYYDSTYIWNPKKKCKKTKWKQIQSYRYKKVVARGKGFCEAGHNKCRKLLYCLS